MSSDSPPHRRWFQFSLNTFFMLVAVLGVSPGWLGVQLKWMRDRCAALDPVNFDCCRLVNDTDGIAPFGLRPFGARGFQNLLLYAQPRSSEKQMRETLERTKLLFPEAKVLITIDFGDVISEDDLKYLEQHPGLKAYRQF